MNRQSARKVILLELNEITWTILERFRRRGLLPTFDEFVREGTKGAPRATEAPAALDPWISWTSLYTGRPQEEHRVRFLEQPPGTVTGPRVWDIAADAGKTVGVFGSIMSWPPREDVRGFWVPSTFSPDPQTFPRALEPIQELNLMATRAHTPVPGKQSRPALGKLALRLAKLGLRPSSVAEAISFIVRSRLRPHRSWEKVSLQPTINLDFFEKLHRQHRPDLATFHSNHVAHYQHRFWRAMDSAPFPVPASEDERRRFGLAIEHGYRVADRVLRRIWKLAAADTVVIVASGLGQKPYVADEFREGREIVRIRDIRQIVKLCGVAGHCTPVSMMAPQWNLRIPDGDRRAQAERVLRSAWYRAPGTRLFAFETAGDTINFNVFQKNLRPLELDAPCGFPDAGGRQLTLGELCAVADATPKEGQHDPVGVALLRGPGIRRGAELRECTNLDFAPTILHLLGVPAPSHMKGRVLEEALEKGSSPSAVPAAAGRPPLDAAAASQAAR